MTSALAAVLNMAIKIVCHRGTKVQIQLVEKGAKWFDEKFRPEDWNLEIQLKNIATSS